MSVNGKILKILLCLVLSVFAINALGQESSTNKRTAAQSALAKKTGIAPHESLDSLALAPGQLTALPVITGEKSDFDKFTRELIQVQWRDNDPIDLYVIRPKGIARPRAVLYLYSYPTENNRFRDEGYCERITFGGVAAIGFVSALTGHRYHDRPMKEWFVSELPEALTLSVHDVQMVLDYLKQRGDLDLSDIGIFGQGSGATIAILAASVDSRIRKLDLLDAWGDWPVWMAKSSLVPDAERKAYLKPNFLASVAPLDPTRYLPKLTQQAIRLQYRSDDTVTPPGAAAKIAAAAPSGAQIVHYASAKEMYQATSGGRLFDWIKGQSKGTAKVAPDPSSVRPSTADASSQQSQW